LLINGQTQSIFTGDQGHIHRFIIDKKLFSSN